MSDAHSSEKTSAPSSAAAATSAVKDAVRGADSAVEGLLGSLGLAAHVEKRPYLAVGVALGIGYALGGGLFSATTARLLRLGVKLTSKGTLQERILEFAREVIRERR